MRLPEDDEEYLNGKSFDWEVAPDANGGFLVIRNYPLHPERYEPARTDLMIRIPAQYPLAQLDMFYVAPEVRLKGGSYPQNAEVFEEFLGRRWQRFSRHLAQPWRAGVDGLPMFLSLIHSELQAGK